MLSNSIKLKERIASKQNIFLLLLLQLRPHQWTKNLLVFAALLFSLHKVSIHLLGKSLIAFFLFCMVSGCVYIINDFADIKNDRNHPEKRYRPMASGALNPFLGLAFGCGLLIASLFSAFHFDLWFGSVLLFYFLINVAYSFTLKHVVILDVMIISAGFVLRAIGGSLMIGTPFTPWFLLCTMLLSLFLAISKRRHELYLLQEEKGSHRKVLENYSIELLNQLNTIVTSATIISYSLFTFTSGRTIQLMWTIPFVIFGIFRYLYLIMMGNKGGTPEKVLVEDKPILITVLLYVIAVASIILIFE
ncbi:decaprenyl-phosphate phosphoribosyltransferase [Brevibacillus sp. 7WMA2]|uniref:Decaprenyl-phosphate phosphoribosyltransferase n=1 Tax=Brevibacillus laterosporus LMG 15441 TaxID=1042163 RepID=A0A075R7E5_BRELA|nr:MULTISPECIES: decaprenyl-phosphate phosphoribosyltransferase [Brevibacillus]MBA4533665.1 decaprenyl-phosphate phosphoribosyltransferase [Brevibacillus halotolerans]AIG27749.1 decaprenyl-phosphate phosphoribosyltransferase [Brevibacillus laterosporus LMG 15441]AUM66017.1 decaprenyl-phosphate phosphoribosyltransferase [Brevibacillus laterosporus]ERM19359.1 phosphoribose diphosphate:decaprenyl-phosphate phosphoribosyltransferase [Brevibacillus laterosporus PE36]MCR8962292.1 decaprenyl-phosphat